MWIIHFLAETVLHGLNLEIIITHYATFITITAAGLRSQAVGGSGSHFVQQRLLIKENKYENIINKFSDFVCGRDADIPFTNAALFSILLR